MEPLNVTQRTEGWLHIILLWASSSLYHQHKRQRHSTLLCSTTNATHHCGKDQGLARYTLKNKGASKGSSSDAIDRRTIFGSTKHHSVKGSKKNHLFLTFLLSEGKGSGVWPNMVTHTWNLCSAFNPFKCTHTVVNTHLEQWAANAAAPGEQLVVRALLKGLTSVMVLKERVLVIHSPTYNPCRT